MCDFTQREYACGHFRWIASKWCPTYGLTSKRCEPNVTHFVYMQDDDCGHCKWLAWRKREPCPWENMIKRVRRKA